jgi:hypothetical protein
VSLGVEHLDKRLGTKGGLGDIVREPQEDADILWRLLLINMQAQLIGGNHG